ncbi:hypothetical protein OR1_03564 [Geobacter sp. OR-1]|uniref:hypothetical protein n=1 Tax=Geobacter sp. OR-1 TaxID=1266765 RepID=UPI000543FC19|nr:hypothetical protein [Geobacter sp. OR-1]GAM11253.1 hypothetical protein OR1_03564 [Geobacter sp. OR-1]
MRLGEDGTGFLVDLWIAVALDRPNGVLSGLDDVDIALMAGWEGDSKQFVSALIETGFIDQDCDGMYSVHDWVEHNGYASAAAVRSEAARKAAHAKWSKKQVNDAPADILECDSNESAMQPHENAPTITVERSSQCVELNIS